MNEVDHAFWVKGKEIIPVGTVHIRYIMDNPDKFGLTKEEIWAWYDRNKEKRGLEGKTREQIIRKVAEDGWIRVRHYIRPRDFWSIQTYDARKDKKAIENFILWCLNEGTMSMNDEVHIMSYKDDSMKSYSYQDGGIRTYLFEKVQEGDNLYESSINRLLTHNEKHDCAIVSAFREYRTYKENIALSKKLYHSLLSLGYKLIRVEGTYVYDTLSDEEMLKLRKGEMGLSGLNIKEEISYFVIDMQDSKSLEKDIKFIGKEFEQDSVAFLPKNEDSLILFGTNPDNTYRSPDNDWPILYGEKRKFSKMVIGRNNIFMTKVNRKPFFYENIEDIPLVANSRAMSVVYKALDKQFHDKLIKNRRMN